MGDLLGSPRVASPSLFFFFLFSFFMSVFLAAHLWRTSFITLLSGSGDERKERERLLILPFEFRGIVLINMPWGSWVMKEVDKKDY